MAIAEPPATTTFSELRQQLDCLRDIGQLLEITDPVDNSWETGTICRESLDRHGPALLFTNIQGHRTPLAANLFGTRERYAASLGVLPDIRAFHERWQQAFREPIRPSIVGGAPCREVTLDRINLSGDPFPVPIWHARDGGRMLGTMHNVITRDPETGWINNGCYRNQVLSETTLGCNAPPSRHLQIHWRKYRDLGRPMPVVIAIGLDPYLSLVGCGNVPHGVDEYAVAGGLKGSPIEVVEAQLSDLLVPATAEIVLEAEMPTDQPVAEEGPFGEFTGYLGAAAHHCPAIEVKLVYHRRDPIFQGALEGRGPSEGATMKSIAKSVAIYEHLQKAGVIGLKDVCVTEASCGTLHTIVAIDKLYAGHAQDVMYQVWGMPGLFTKHVFVVDGDVDPWDRFQVEYAMATTVQARRDIQIVRGKSSGLDPSVPPSQRPWSDLMGIDATRPFEYYKYDGSEFPPSNQPPDDWLARVRDRWREYGLS